MLSDPRFWTTVVYVCNPSLWHRCPERWATLGDGTGCRMRETVSQGLKQRKTHAQREKKRGGIFPSSLSAECELRKTIKNHGK